MFVSFQLLKCAMEAFSSKAEEYSNVIFSEKWETNTRHFLRRKDLAFLLYRHALCTEYIPQPNLIISPFSSEGCR